jgi:glycerate kinase
VVAPDSFKGSLDATAVAGAMAAGVRLAAPDASVVLRPMADGGEGTLAAVAGAWHVRLRSVPTVDAIGRPAAAAWALDDTGAVAVVELASASGLPGVADVSLRPREAHTRGVGLLALAALDSGAQEVVVCLGGSASTDGGAGFLTGLGARVLDASGRDVPDGGAGLAEAARLDLAGLHPRAREVRWRLAVDVTNPLCGPSGAAHVFGPQKGATPDDVGFLDAALGNWADILRRETGVDARDLPGAGAAGGVPTGLVATLGATIEPGAGLVADAIGLPAALADASLVITGEGSFDGQSLSGKVAGTVARLAAAAPATPPVVVIAGRVALDAATARAAGITAAFSIAPGPIALDDLVGQTRDRLAEVAASVTALVFNAGD